MIEKKHIQWIDIVKGITIIVVVFLHIVYQYPVTNAFHLKSVLGDAWDMPVFFLVGGFFLNADKLSHPGIFLWHKFKTLYLKLLYYYISFLCLHNLLVRTGFLSTTLEYGGKYMRLFDINSFMSKMFQAVFFMGREPYLSPLWFVYVMFMAFIVLSVLSYLTKKIRLNSYNRWLFIMTIVLATLCTISLISTNVYNFTIPRINNTFSSCWLIFCGYLLFNKLQCRFNNGYVALLSLLVLFGITLTNEHMALMTNSYMDIVQLTACGVSALYVLSYLSIKIEHCTLGCILAYIGKNSFHIMALHLLCFNIFACFINFILKTSFPINVLGSNATNCYELFAFTFAGIVLPITIIFIISKFKYLLTLCKRKFVF